MTSSVTKILNSNNQRTELMVQNTGTTTVYVVLGQPTGTPDYTYGIPLAPYGQAESMLDLQVQPDPSKNLHTWTSAVYVVLSTGTTGTCVYAEKSN